MDVRAALVTLAAWEATSDDDRAAVLTALATTLGDGWRAGAVRTGRAGLGRLHHDPIGQAFVVVPGGWLRMGLSCDDLFAAARARDEGGAAPSWGPTPLGARPTHWVRMRPYLLAVAGVPPEGEARGTDGGVASKTYRDAVDATREHRDDGPSTQELIDAYDGNAPRDEREPEMRIVTPEEAAELVPPGFRMVSEAELEWAFREGGTTRWLGVAGDVTVTPENRRAVLLGELENGFGLIGFRDLQNLCADGAVNYDPDSPIEQDARSTDSPQRIARWAHTYWQDDDAELLAMHAGSRAAPDEYGESILRLAHDLPELAGPEGDPPAPLAEHAYTLTALVGTDERARGDALCALCYLGRGLGHDVAPTAEAVLSALPELDGDVLAATLVWLADAQTGGHRDQLMLPPERKRRGSLRDDRDGVRAAVAAASERIAALLDHATPEVRSAAALALAFCVDVDAAARQALATRLGREPEVAVQASLLLALLRLGHGFRAPPLEPLIRGALAVATAFDGAPNLPELIAAMRLAPVPLVAWNRGDLAGVATGLLLRQPPDVQLELAPDLAERAVECGDGALAERVFELVFGERPEQATPRLPDELTGAQRRVMRILVAVEGRIAWFPYGLPRTVAGRRRFLGLDAAGPTERFVPDGDREVPLWYALRVAQLAAQDGGEAASAVADRLLADVSPAERLVLWLDRFALDADRGLAHWDREALYAAVAGDADATAQVDALVAQQTEPLGRELIEAVVRTRPEGAAIDPSLVDRLGDGELGGAVAVLGRFPHAIVEARLVRALAPLLARALAADDWVIGIDHALTELAPALAAVPSARVARQLLLLGWASGQPASVREAVGEAGAGHAAIAEVLAQYDSLPQFTSWPRARAVLPTYAE